VDRQNRGKIVPYDKGNSPKERIKRRLYRWRWWNSE